jgi:hypothetical protein
MAKTGVNYNKITGEIGRVVIVSKDSDLTLNKQHGMTLMEVAADHPCVGLPDEYEVKEYEVKEGKVKEGKVKEGKVKEGKVKEGKVKKKTAARIKKEKKEKADKKNIII